MSNVQRFLFDECVGKPVMEHIRSLVLSEAEFVHITDYFRSGKLDEEWIPQLGVEGNWVVITADAGKHSKRGQKLPELCRANGITHLILSATLHQKKSHEKAGAIVSVWEHIEALHKVKPGSRHQLRYRSAKGKGAGLVIVVDPPPVSD